MHRLRSLSAGAAPAAAAFALLLVAHLAAAAPNKLPPGFKLCLRDDENTIPCLEEALVVAVQQLKPGLPEFGIPSLEPFQIPQLGIGDSNSDAPVNLHINFTDIHIYNLKEAKPSNIKLDVDKFEMSAHEHVDKVYAEAHYVMDGRILLIPAKGEGKVTFNLTNLDGDISFKGEKHSKKNKEHLKITDFTFVVTDLEKMDLHFDNLFNGDKTLGPSVNNLVNENWMELWSQLKEPLEDTFGYTFREYARRIFDKVPLDDIFLHKTR